MLLLVVAAANEYAALSSAGGVAQPPPEGGLAAPLWGCPCCVTGVGPINAALSLGQALAALPGVRAVCSLGLAGAYDLARTPLGSVWRVRQEFWPEYGLKRHDTPVADARALGFAVQQATATAPAVWDNLLLASPPAGVPQAVAQCYPDFAEAFATLPEAVSLTVAGASGTPEQAQALYEHYAPLTGQTPLLEHMEGFALALACRRRGLPLFAARVIANLAGGDAANRDFARALRVLPALAQRLLAGEAYAAT